MKTNYELVREAETLQEIINLAEEGDRACAAGEQIIIAPCPGDVAKAMERLVIVLDKKILDINDAHSNPIIRAIEISKATQEWLANVRGCSNCGHSGWAIGEGRSSDDPCHSDMRPGYERDYKKALEFLG